MKVVKEDAYVSFDPTNPTALQASTPGGSLNAGALTLKVNVQELPDQPAETAAAGDIDLAGLTVTLAPSTGGGTITLNCSAPAAGSGYAIKTFTCTNDVAIPVGAYEVTASVTGNSYVGVGYDVLTIDDPIPGFATGGGWFYWPGTGDKTNFGFTTKYNKSGANLKGSLLVIRHHQDGTISRIKSNALEELKLRNVGGCSIATFSGKATYKTWDAAARRLRELRRKRVLGLRRGLQQPRQRRRLVLGQRRRQPGLAYPGAQQQGADRRWQYRRAARSQGVTLAGM